MYRHKYGWSKSHNGKMWWVSLAIPKTPDSPILRAHRACYNTKTKELVITDGTYATKFYVRGVQHAEDVLLAFRTTTSEIAGH